MPIRRRKRDRLVWVDLEMTGLDVEREVIVEIATIVTESDLTIVAEGPEIVIHATDEQLAGMAPVVQEMHAASGLTDEIRTAATTVREAEVATLAFLQEHCSGPKQHPLCGNSIGTDRRFIQRYMPELAEWLHYRSVDVSSIKELARRWNRKIYEARPDKSKGHRALTDIRESIEELAYWRDSLFRLSGGAKPAAVDAPAPGAVPDASSGTPSDTPTDPPSDA